MNSVGSSPLNALPAGDPSIQPVSVGMTPDQPGDEVAGFDSFLSQPASGALARSGKPSASIPSGAGVVKPLAESFSEALAVESEGVPIQTPEGAPQSPETPIAAGELSCTSPESQRDDDLPPQCVSWMAACMVVVQPPPSVSRPVPPHDQDAIGEGVTTQEEATGQPFSNASMPDQPAMDCGNGIPANGHPTIPAPSGHPVRQKTLAAKIAGSGDSVDANVSPAMADIEKSAPSIHVQHVDGMSVAMQHESMPPLHFQPSKSTPRLPAESVVALQSAPVAVVEAPRPVAQAFAGQNQERDNDTPSEGSTLFDSAIVVPSMRETSPNAPAAGIVKTENVQDTSALFHHTMEAAERMRSNGESNVEIQVRLHDGQEVTIQLKMSSGEFQPVFKTESVELRAALEQNWSQFTSNTADRGLRITAPVFQTPQSGMGDFQQRQERPPQQEASWFAGEEFQRPSSARPLAAVQVPGAGPFGTPGSLALFA